jgi:hypothetical protein
LATSCVRRRSRREAERWLAHIADQPSDTGRLPTAVYAVAARLRGIENATAEPAAVPTVRVPSTTGGGLLLHASRLNDSAGGDIAVLIEPAHPATTAPLLLSASGLTPRERDVAPEAIDAQLLFKGGRLGEKRTARLVGELAVLILGHEPSYMIAGGAASAITLFWPGS